MNQRWRRVLSLMLCIVLFARLSLAVRAAQPQYALSDLRVNETSAVRLTAEADCLLYVALYEEGGSRHRCGTGARR